MIMSEIRLCHESPHVRPTSPQSATGTSDTESHNKMIFK